MGINAAIEEAKSNNNGKPTCIIAKTIIGKGIDEVAGTNAAHGEAGVAFVDDARKSIGLPEDKWYVSPDTYSYFADKKAANKKEYDDCRRPTRPGRRPTRSSPPRSKAPWQRTANRRTKFWP